MEKLGLDVLEIILEALCGRPVRDCRLKGLLSDLLKEQDVSPGQLSY